jgi:hypothetical protein
MRKATERPARRGRSLLSAAVLRDSARLHVAIGGMVKSRCHDIDHTRPGLPGCSARIGPRAVASRSERCRRLSAQRLHVIVGGIGYIEPVVQQPVDGFAPATATVIGLCAATALGLVQATGAASIVIAAACRLLIRLAFAARKGLVAMTGA